MQKLMESKLAQKFSWFQQPHLLHRQAIVNYAEQNNIDIIVMGTRGRWGSRKCCLGSTALGVLTYAHCPVMIVR